jgi:hypothetical protein
MEVMVFRCIWRGHLYQAPQGWAGLPMRTTEDKDMKQQGLEPLCIAGEKAEWCHCCGNSLVLFKVLSYSMGQQFLSYRCSPIPSTSSQHL